MANPAIIQPGKRCECRDRTCGHIEDSPFQQPVRCVLDAVRMVTIGKHVRGKYEFWAEDKVAMCDLCAKAYESRCEL